MDTKNRPRIFRQSLRVPSGWGVRNHKFYDIDPERMDEVEGYTFDEKWLCLDNELLVCEYEKNGIKWTLDMGWFPEYELEGEYILRLVKNDDWRNREYIKETRQILEITQAANETMLRLSQENGDFTSDHIGTRLQLLIPNDGCRFVKNEFFELQPGGDLTQKQWQLFHEQLLRIESWSSKAGRIEMGWLPAHNPNGSYVAKLINEDLETPLLGEFSTRSKNQMVEYLNQAMDGRMYELRIKQIQREKERRRQQKLTTQRNAQAK